jgi:glycosyltransferase involved in cell wall biosynthesis
VLSVIVPTRNRAERLELALRSLARQSLPASSFEIIVVDNGSSDRTREVVAEFEKTVGGIHYIYEASPGLHVGRHHGLRTALGDILVFVDDDIEAFPTLLSSINAAFENYKVALVGGKCLPKYEGRVPEWLSAMWIPNSRGERSIGYLSLIDLGELPKPVNPLLIFGCNFSIRRSLLVEAGGFHPDGLPEKLTCFRGDGETYVSRYLAKRGYTAYYHPKASVYHHVPQNRMTIEYFRQRAYNEGISSSYAKIRSSHGLDSCASIGPTETYGSGSLWARIRRTRPKEIVKRLVQKRLQSIANKLSATQNDYSEVIAAAYEAGYVFHQKAFQESEILRAWVLRPDYWDAQVPSQEI